MSALGNLSGDVRAWWPDGRGQLVVVSDGTWSGGETAGERFTVWDSREAFDELQAECPRPSYVWHEQVGTVDRRGKVGVR